MNKGKRQQDTDGKGPLGLIEQQLVQAVARYVPNLVHEAENLLSASAKGVVQLHANYGGIRLRLVAADGVAIDGMHILGSPVQVPRTCCMHPAARTWCTHARTPRADPLHASTCTSSDGLPRSSSWSPTRPTSLRAS